MKALDEEKKTRIERISEVVAGKVGCLTAFAVEAGSAAIVILICWAVTEIVKGLLA